MLKNEDLKVINKLLKGEEVEEVLSHKIKEKVEYVVEILELQEKAAEEITLIRDKIVDLDRVNKNEESKEK